MIIECIHCVANVDAKVLAERVFPGDDSYDPHKYVFLECPACESIMLGWTEPEPDEYGKWDYGEGQRLYPDPPVYFDLSIPQMVRNSLKEAKLCLKVRAYSASAVMSGRAIEAICLLKANVKTLAAGLKKLKNMNIIDERLYEWGEALRKERNIGAHANENPVEKEDAIDVFDFAKAFCDYIYVLAEKYDEYVERKKKQ